MNKLKTLAVAVALAAVAPAFAQTASAAEVTPYNLVGVSYVNTTLMPKHGDNNGLNGFGVKFIHGFAISQARPMFVEAGLNYTMGFNSDSQEYGGYKVSNSQTYGALAIPVNFAYRFGIGDGNISVKPYIGLNAKFNLIGSTKLSMGDQSDTEGWYKKDTVDASRFQIGWHIGVGGQYQNYYLALQYGTDFNEFANSVTTGTFELTLGYSF